MTSRLAVATPVEMATNAPDNRHDGVLLAGVTFAVTLVPLLLNPSGWLAGSAAIAAVILVPTSHTFVRRLARNLALGIPLVAISSYPSLQSVGAPLVLSGACSVVAFTVARYGWNRVIPSPSRFECLALATVASAATLIGSPFISPSAPRSLGVLLQGWDHASHFDMYMARRTGTAVVGPGDDSWYFAHYPQYFHAFIAGIGDLVWGPVGSVSEELTRYGSLQLTVFVIIALMAAATILDAVSGSSRAARGWALALLGLALFIFPGPSLLLSAHLNFLLAACAAAALIVMANGVASATPVHIVTMASLVVLVASWPLLLPCVALPSLKVVASGLRSPRNRVATIASATASLGASAYLVGISAGSDPMAHLAESGGFAYPGPLGMMVVLIVLIVTTRPRGIPRSPQVADIFVASASSVVLLIGIALLQLAQAGALSYYFWKAALGAVLVLTLAAAPHAVVPWRTLIAALRRRLDPAAAILVAGSVLVLVSLGGITQLPVGGLEMFRIMRHPEAAGASDVERQLLSVTNDPSLDPAATTFVTAAGGRYSPALLNQWYHSLTRTRTLHAARADFLLDAPPAASPDHLRTVLARLAQASGDGTMVFTDASLHGAAAGLVAEGARGQAPVLLTSR